MYSNSFTNCVDISSLNLLSNRGNLFDSRLEVLDTGSSFFLEDLRVFGVAFA